MIGVAVVTGGARNLGRAVVLGLAHSGYDVVVNTRADAEAAEKVAAEARSFGVAAVAAIADVSDPEQVQQMFTAADAMGPLRVLVNNAAARTRIPAYEMSPADWIAVRSVTLDGAMHCAMAALPRLRAGGGSIVSIIGDNALAGDPGRFHVSAAKHGLIGMTKALAAACTLDRINVNAISPAHMTPPPGHAEPERESARRRDSVAAMVTFLASPVGADVTGQIITVGAEHPASGV